MNGKDWCNRRIVVGVDGSPSSMTALRWSLRQAKPSTYGFSPTTDGASDFEGDAQKILFDALNEVSGEGPGVIIRPSVVEGHPADVLVREARGADLLVVGSRGYGGFAGVLLGSVSQHCVHHAPCSVLVIQGTGS